ncbi:cupin domain-containing protein [Luteipulveratus sp. YIM 133132]|uniref:Cupin domain-containing protein n=1 Tax=Luteipulveratus flavus TaxID=3031728 RepID=A0ABT6CEB4_9MICO|nr:MULTISPECIES: cupin domain-containing protein [unclassified Luteipulveratus]MDE9364907.1 cupin domain-containing protein [Luteipulveratus sp. YIM 133132]MDF8266379.1 cupin domain-containing protein [Luteipulveratus sp. YIM 133296]
MSAAPTSQRDPAELPSWARGLGLQPHPEGGWFAETYRHASTFRPQGYDGARAYATSILFLLLPGEESRWHRVTSDELWLHHRGGPLSLDLGGNGDAPAGGDGVRTVRLGSDYPGGEVAQALVPGGHWQAARPAGDEPVLVGCVVAPGFDFADFALLPDQP